MILATETYTFIAAETGFSVFAAQSYLELLRIVWLGRMNLNFLQVVRNLICGHFWVSLVQATE
jgi:hypothetical protein